MPPAAPPPTMRESEAPPQTGALDDLAGLLEALRTVPGRKVIAFFSAGLATRTSAQVSTVSAAAVAARTTIHVFAMPGPRGRCRPGPADGAARDARALHGRTVLSPGRNPERAVARTATELAACYVVKLEPAPTDADGRRRTLRVEVAGRGLNVRAPAWLLPSADPEDQPVQEAPASAPTPGAAEPAAPAEAAARPARPAEAPSAREAELQLAMARLVEYVEAYERQYSGPRGRGGVPPVRPRQEHPAAVGLSAGQAGEGDRVGVVSRRLRGRRRRRQGS